MSNVSIICRLVGKWLNGRSELFSKMCQEECTRKEVMRIHLITLMILLVIGLAEQHTLICVLLAGITTFLVLKKKADNEDKHDDAY